jgi:hypothetical protein
VSDDWDDDDGEDERVSPHDPSSHRLRILNAKCETCVFKPGNPMHLRPGKLRALIAANLAADAPLVCHSTLPYGKNPDFGPAVCHGWDESYDTNGVLIMKRLGGVDLIDPPP